MPTLIGVSRFLRVTTSAIVLATAACSSAGVGDGQPETDRSEPGIIAATPTPEPDPELETTDLPVEEEGVLVNRFDLDPGDCFNTYGVLANDEETQPTTRAVECTRAHESEVYYQRNYPGGADEPFPGVEELYRRAETRCYDEFPEFTGSEYVTSDLDIGVIHPTFETWTGPGLHREFTCFVFALGGGGLQGSMADTGL